VAAHLENLLLQLDVLSNVFKIIIDATESRLHRQLLATFCLASVGAISQAAN
jgi:hypothetical protein